MNTSLRLRFLLLPALLFLPSAALLGAAAAPARPAEKPGAGLPPLVGGEDRSGRSMPPVFRGAAEQAPEIAWTNLRAGGEPVGHSKIEQGAAALRLGIPNVPDIPITHFPAGGKFRAALPRGLRSPGSWVGFDFGGIAAEDPADGAILEIDGAAIGFRKQVEPDGRYLARIMVRAGAGAEARWEPTPYLVFPGSIAPAVLAGEIRIQFHPEAKTWDLYTHGHLMKAQIPYEPESGAEPRFGVDPGKGETPAQLRKVVVGIMPARPVSGTPRK